MKLYQKLAHLVQARLNCLKSNNAEWLDRHTESILSIVKEGPSGSGWDCGTKIDLDKSTGEKLFFFGSWHHMNEDGYYDGWTDHTIVVRPSLSSGIELRVTGRNRNDIKDVIHDDFWTWLEQEESWKD